jgi:hypothetical protein
MCYAHFRRGVAMILPPAAGDDGGSVMHPARWRISRHIRASDASHGAGRVEIL